MPTNPPWRTAEPTEPATPAEDSSGGARLVPDTIAAVATPPGRGAVALLRVSGPGAHGILKALAPTLDPLPEPRVSTLAALRDPEGEGLLDRAVVVRYDGPASYTGEDVVEISTHGGAMAPGLVLDACLRLGARRAEAGEFTQRAYLNGKLDLVQAEAVADVVESRSRALHRASLHQLEAGLSGRLESLRSELVALEAFLVHHVDFPEEDEAPATPESIAERAEGLAKWLGELLATAPEGELLRDGVLTVLAGRPNAGKSSLFNALLGESRAIVTETPGTTRDALEAVVSVGGYPFRMVDTAGLREAGEEVERLGIEVARRYVEGAHLVLLCVDPERGWGEAEEGFARRLAPPGETERGRGSAGARLVVLATKSDRAREGDAEEVVQRARAAGAVEVLAVSAMSGEGLDGVRRTLPELLFRGLVEAEDDAPVLTRRRQVREAERARGEVQAFAAALREGIPAEVAGTHLATAKAALEELLGIISPEEVLDHLFREFCIGK